MVHTYEVFVDICDYSGLPNPAPHSATTRYEIDAESQSLADMNARNRARTEYPSATEYDIRVTRLLR